MIQLLDATTGRTVTDRPFSHKCDVLELALDQHLPAAQRKLAFVDANRDLFLLTTRRVGGARKVLRLGTQGAAAAEFWESCFSQEHFVRSCIYVHEEVSANIWLWIPCQ